VATRGIDTYAEGTSWTDRPDLLALLDAHGARPGRVLDVGCGTGLLGEALLRRGAAEVWGVEVEPEVAAAAGERLTRVLRASFPTRELAGERFDLVVFADVLEHMADPWSALAGVPSLLTDNGLVLLSVPNVSHYTVVWPLLAGRWRYEGFGLLDRDHLRFFTPASMRDLLRTNGLEVVAWRETRLARPRRYRPLEALLGLVAPHQLACQLLVLARTAVSTP
jgi:predicted TPR repeat methyltransferase